MLTLDELDIIKFMNHPRLLKFSFEDKTIMTLGLYIESKHIKKILPTDLGFKILYCYSEIDKTYEGVLIDKDDKLYNIVLSYFIEHKLCK